MHTQSDIEKCLQQALCVRACMDGWSSTGRQPFSELGHMEDILYIISVGVYAWIKLLRASEGKTKFYARITDKTLEITDIHLSQPARLQYDHTTHSLYTSAYLHTQNLFYAYTDIIHKSTYIIVYTTMPGSVI